MSWISFEQFCAFLHFGPYVYLYIWLGPFEKKLVDVLDNRRIQKDVPDNQKMSETEEGYEDLSGSRPFKIEYLLGIAC